MIAALSSWRRRRWLAAAGAALATALAIGVPTAMIPAPFFGRQIPPTAWSWPVLVVTSVLSGLLLATYIREPGVAAQTTGLNRTGTVGGFLAYLAVGCPVCNKLALIALGYAGALQWFAPAQPFLAAAGIVLLAWALRARLRGEIACPVPSRPAQAEPANAGTVVRP